MNEKPEKCPECGAGRSGIQDQRVPFPCGSEWVAGEFRKRCTDLPLTLLHQDSAVEKVSNVELGSGCVAADRPIDAPLAAWTDARIHEEIDKILEPMNYGPGLRTRVFALVKRIGGPQSDPIVVVNEDGSIRLKPGEYKVVSN